MTEAIDVTSPEFLRWFGQSKVVDHYGKPLRVYHGTRRDFQEFSLDFLGSNTTANNTAIGFFFTDSPGVADQFAQGEGGRQLAVYLSMQKPFIIKPSEFEYSMRRTSYELNYSRNPEHVPLRRHYHPRKDPYHQLYDWVMALKRDKDGSDGPITKEDCALLRARLVAGNFDGIIVRETYMDAPLGERSGMHDFYIVLRPDQIRSAISNI